MLWLTVKYGITAFMIVLISELAKRSDRLGGLIAALPIMTLLTLIWLYVENQPSEKIANHAWYTFWYVIPTLPIFLFFPYLLPRIGFWPTLGTSVIITLICFIVFAFILKRFGITLI
jgi:F0F1-type ATP synthase assembly protein I